MTAGGMRLTLLILLPVMTWSQKRKRVKSENMKSHLPPHHQRANLRAFLVRHTLNIAQEFAKGKKRRKLKS